MIKEIRNSNNEITPILPESRTVSGYAIVFNSDSNDLGGFIESNLSNLHQSTSII